MKPSEFQALVECLNELSNAQRTALTAALESTDALGLIDARFGADPSCGIVAPKALAPGADPMVFVNIVAGTASGRSML